MAGGKDRHPHRRGERQCLGCVGKLPNGINTVHLTYARPPAGGQNVARRPAPLQQVLRILSSPV